MAPTSVMTEEEAPPVPRPVVADAPGSSPRVSVPAARSRATVADTDENWAETARLEARLEARYWRLVTQYLADYQMSYGALAAGPGDASGKDSASEPDAAPVYRSPHQAGQAADRFRADAEAASDRARQAQREARAAFTRINKAQTALLQAPRWRWRLRNRLRADAERERQRLAAAQHQFGEHSASMDLALRESEQAGQIAIALRRYDRAHLAAAAAAERALGWSPGKPVTSRPTRFIAGQRSIEAAR